MNKDHETTIDSKKGENLPVTPTTVSSKVPGNDHRKYQISDRHFTVNLPTTHTFRSKYDTCSGRPGIKPRKIT